MKQSDMAQEGNVISPAQVRPWLLLVMAIGLPVIWLGQDLGGMLYVAIIVCALAFLPLAYGIATRDRDWFQPIYVFALMYAVIYGARTIYLLYAEPVTPLPLVDLQSAGANKAMLLAASGLVMALLGYYSGIGSGVGRALPAINTSLIARSSVLFAIIAVFVLSAAGKFYQLYTGKILAYASAQYPGYDWEKPVGYAATFGIVAFALAVAYQFQTRKALGIFWFLILPAEVMYWFLRGSRSEWFVMLAITLILFHYLVRPFGVMRLGLFAGLFFLLVTFTYPLQSNYRVVVRPGDLQLTTLVSDVRRELREIREMERDKPDDQKGVKYASKLLIEKQSGIEQFTRAVDHADVTGQVYGKTLAMVPAVWIPEVLWPNKYELLSQTRVIAGTALFGADQGYGLNLGQPAELYVNFGAAGVIIGMFAIGVLLRVLYTYCRRKELGAFGPVVYALLFMSLAIGQGSWFFETYGNGIRTAVLVLILVWGMSVISARRQTAHEQA